MAAFLSPLPLSLLHPSGVSTSTTSPGARNFPRRRPCLSLDIPPPKQPPSTIPFNPSTSALREAILSVAVGKFGKKPIPPALLPRLQSELDLAARTPPSSQWLSLHLQRASLLGSLYIKDSHTPTELAVFQCVTGKEEFPTPADIVCVVNERGFCQGSALEMFALRLLRGEYLSKGEARDLGDLLYCVEKEGVSTWGMRVLIAHIMRVRHESGEELRGLCVAAGRTLRKDWGGKGDGRKLRFVHVVEPFDGVFTADLLTPLICKRMKEVYGMRPVMGVGRSSGPKYGPNLRDILKELGVRFCESGEEVEEEDGEFGVCVDQGVSSGGLDRWVDVRRVIVKRPSIATTEKYVDCVGGGSGMFVGSAFHGGYVEKMGDCAEECGYEGYVIVGRGLEGTLGVGVLESTGGKFLVGWKKEDGGYGRELVTFKVEKDGGGWVLQREFRAERGSATVKRNVERIRRLLEHGSSGDEMFDSRVAATFKAFDKAFAVLRRERSDLFGKVDEGKVGTV